jgi:hypothetical protein
MDVPLRLRSLQAGTRGRRETQRRAKSLRKGQLNRHTSTSHYHTNTGQTGAVTAVASKSLPGLAKQGAVRNSAIRETPTVQ